jgi:geranylgeranyl pyrophosphate synthase
MVSIEYVKNKAISHCEKAKNAIEILKETAAKKILFELANYTISREK